MIMEYETLMTAQNAIAQMVLNDGGKVKMMAYDKDGDLLFENTIELPRNARNARNRDKRCMSAKNTK